MIESKPFHYSGFSLGRIIFAVGIVAGEIWEGIVNQSESLKERG